MAEVKWIKITTDMFDNRKVKHLRKLPEGNNIVLIWVMLLTMAGRCNASGMIFLTENIPYTPKMLADELDFEENTVTLALNVLEQLNMIAMDNGFFSISGWAEHQNIDGMEKIREQTRKRVAEHRKKRNESIKRLQQEGNAMCNATVTECNATDKEEEKERDKDKEIYISIVGHLNEKAGTKYKPSSQATQRHINGRLAEGFTLEDFKTVIDKKCEEWAGTDMEKYLRPETLFGTKFESYLNARGAAKSEKPTGTDDTITDRVGQWL